MRVVLLRHLVVGHKLWRTSVPTAPIVMSSTSSPSASSSTVAAIAINVAVAVAVDVAVAVNVDVDVSISSTTPAIGVEVLIQVRVRVGGWIPGVCVPLRVDELLLGITPAIKRIRSVVVISHILHVLEPRAIVEPSVLLGMVTWLLMLRSSMILSRILAFVMRS
jgi:hypothetical protein